MSNVFTIVSPLGYVVSCTQSQWDNHILVNHPNMKNKEDLVAFAITKPQWVYQSDTFPSRDVYFAISGNTNEKLKFTKVVVETSTPDDAEVVTAWMQPSVSGNINSGVIKYVSPKL